MQRDAPCDNRSLVIVLFLRLSAISSADVPILSKDTNRNTMKTTSQYPHAYKKQIHSTTHTVVAFRSMLGCATRRCATRTWLLDAA